MLVSIHNVYKSGVILTKYIHLWCIIQMRSVKRVDVHEKKQVDFKKRGEKT